jgi:hypothetical protein
LLIRRIFLRIIFLSALKGLKKENATNSLSLFRNIEELEPSFDFGELIDCYSFHEEKKVLKVRRKELRLQLKAERHENYRNI